MIKIKVSCVLQFLDDYTEQVITDPVLYMEDENGRKPLRKEGGYYVFLEKGLPVKTVTVTSPFYDRETIRIGETDKEVWKVRLRPGKNYPVSSGMICMEGKAPARSCVGVVLTGMESAFRLLYDYVPEKEADYLEIYHSQGGDLTGMEFLIMERGKKKREFFSVAEYKKETGTCRLTKPLSGSYKKAGSLLYPFYYTRSAEDGHYFLPVRAWLTEPVSCLIYLDGKERKGELKPGKNNRVDF